MDIRGVQTLAGGSAVSDACRQPDRTAHGELDDPTQSAPGNPCQIHLQVGSQLHCGGASCAEHTSARMLKRADQIEPLDDLIREARIGARVKRKRGEIVAIVVRHFIDANLDRMVAEGIRLKLIGDWRKFEPDIVAKLDLALERTAGGTRTLAVALNYGAQQEIARAAAAAAAEGEVTMATIEAHLDTAVFSRVHARRHRSLAVPHPHADLDA